MFSVTHADDLNLRHDINMETILHKGNSGLCNHVFVTLITFYQRTPASNKCLEIWFCVAKNDNNIANCLTDITLPQLQLTLWVRALKSIVFLRVTHNSNSLRQQFMWESVHFIINVSVKSLKNINSFPLDML